MFKINNSYESDPSTGSSSLSNNDLITKTTAATELTLNTEWDFQNGTTLKDYLFPSESSNSTEQTFGKLTNRKQKQHHQHRNSNQTSKTNRSMVNSSQESDFYGFTPKSAASVENANTFLEKIPENTDVVDNDDDDAADDIGRTIEEHIVRYQNELALVNNDDISETTTTTTTTTTTLLGQHLLQEKICDPISAEYGLEQTIASEEFSDQDIRCQTEMAQNEQQLKVRIENAAVDECNESHLTIEPTSSDDEDDNDASLYHLGSPPAAMHKDHVDAIAMPTMITTIAATAVTITNFHRHCSLDEDSNNAVDNAISNEQCKIGGSSTPKDLSFNGKLKNIQLSTADANANELNVMPNNSSSSCSNNENPSDSHEEKDLSTSVINEKSNLELQLQLETSREHINERSPDLFSEIGDFDATENEAIQDDDIVAAAAASAVAATTVDDDDDLGTDVSGINDSADLKTDDTTILTDKHIEKTERALNKHIQSLLSGIIPPPSVTFVQHDISNLLSMYKRNITLMDVPSAIACNNNKKQTEDTSDGTNTNTNPTIPIKPNELDNIEWPQIKRTNAYGLHYNRTKYTDNIEIMYMKLVERNVGQETASSFTVSGVNGASAAAAKKKPMRKLMSSPGNRLSHLARRRAIFSSANLQSQSSQPQLSGQSKLGQKTCVIDASKLSRKEKVATPKRRALAHRRTPGRKTPSSLKKSANKQQQQQNMLPVAPKFGTATRETSKRALFLSPTQEEPATQTIAVNSSSSGDLSQRIEKSKRALFSPPRRLERSISNLSNSSSQNSTTSFGGMLNNGPNKMTTIDRLTYFNRANSDVSINLKRRLEPDDDNENMEPTQHRNKLQRTDHHHYQSMQNYTMQTSKLTKAASENSMYPNQQLSASHKQKLLWAVSTALKKKSITSSNVNFQKYAAILGKAVKRLYLESLSTKTESTSGTMLRLADRLVFWVLKGKSVDEIYLEEKERMGATKNAAKRPSGYVNRDEYLMRLNVASNKLNTSTQSIGGSGGSGGGGGGVSRIGSTNNLYSKSNENLNCSLGDQTRPSLTNSSSKSNVGMSALRENHDSKSAQKSASHQSITASNISFSGRNQKNLSPYNDKTRSITNLNKSNKLLAGGANSSILKVKRQISFDS